MNYRESLFSPAVLRETEALPEQISDELARRRDLRSLSLFTIDPADARDFDDAISIEVLEDSSTRVGVHIADVSYYVREGTALDSEAFSRATSVYLIGGVVPMLPEKISNDLCSLKPNVDRLAFSVMMTMNGNAEIISYDIFRSVIHSKHRFTYEDAQHGIDTRHGPHHEELAQAQALAKKIRERRMKEGSIDFESVEVKFHYDEKGIPVKATRKERLDSMKLIEEFMLLANKTVALHIAKKKDSGKQAPFIYRIHDVPGSERLEDLASVVKRQATSSILRIILQKKFRNSWLPSTGRPKNFL